MTSDDPIKDYTHVNYERERRKKTGKILLIPGAILIILSIIMPFISPLLGWASYPVCFLGAGFFFGGLITIVTNLKKKTPPPPPKDMGLDELMENPPG